ncbi:acetyl-CoA carboxylase, carboxyl transferase, beta subunit [Heliomicrobium modesticaldum Ice1]|uniref:Acetyl-coenzyme A carboxylase carboxyl transferase subunit beta n=1 Tax=Heliobacterium modesticaldum (strain ATCC 51547 / Ice1) TaxID=498761 RepID=ACCD_HELMI|nr:acetyl-CoA carboxylase, carboxyltransferase subunit beta [Heliomicrobium modesticaldum]B0TI33.1 RecName: Full=Acetyl-coenzyme A carboxylase carboxyl transferase subunit beta; Short=ACCase subunit beta; Short=Acetyl-CoA carboxylase carboxyltransferase subunit beta [Heliomicrobium modesticaldum Ice1]ABZ82706.1 acetyl-CoA carboxylase, carboxyl transferase, beta subunit [Heliomicrobium modesticaldum Ice1]
MDGLWVKCKQCQQILLTKELEKNLKVCRCGYHFRMTAQERIVMLVDENSFIEWDRELVSKDPLQFPGYAQKIQKCQIETSMSEAITTGQGRICDIPVVLGVMDPRFIMASMGAVVGEKIVRAAERALKLRLPLVLFSASGGARMQEGVLSLMQMARTSAALTRLSKAGLPFFSVLTDPTTGGVTASFAMLGDLIIAEPGALIGFTGPRVIEQTIRQKLPEGFQRSEFLQKHGMVDIIIERPKMREQLAALLALHCGNSLEGVES